MRTVGYGPGPSQVADVYPAAGERRGIVVSLHGGYFRAMYGRDLHDGLSAALAARGFEVWNAEYRRAGAGGGFAETTGDVLAAVSAAAAGTRPGSVAVAGHSAGGYLACFAARHPAVGLVVSMAGIADPRAAVREGWGPGVGEWLGTGPDEDPALYAAADLAAALPTGARHVLVHGTADDTVPVSESRRFAGALTAAGDEAELVELPGEGHYGFLDPAHPATRRVIGRIDAWFSASSAGSASAGSASAG